MVPPGATHVWVGVVALSIAPRLMIVRVKDKDLNNIGVVGETVSTAGATRVGAPVKVSVDASRIFQIQANGTLFDVLVFVRGWEMAHQ